MPEHHSSFSGEPETEANDGSLHQDGRTDLLSGTSRLGNFDIRLKTITADLQPGGPEVNFQLLVGYIDGVLEPAAMQQVGRIIVTWQAWYDAYWETVGADDSAQETKV
jgi:hypothetical protein